MSKSGIAGTMPPFVHLNMRLTALLSNFSGPGTRLGPGGPGVNKSQCWPMAEHSVGAQSHLAHLDVEIREEFSKEEVFQLPLKVEWVHRVKGEQDMQKGWRDTEQDIFTRRLAIV